MSTREKAAKLLLKLYVIRKRDFALFTVDDILAKATDKEIDYYHHWLCEGGNK